MNEQKKIIPCEQCNHKMRIPLEKHIKFSCPVCNRQYEYDHGIRVIREKNANPIRKKKEIPLAYIVTPLFATLVLIAVLLFKPGKAKKYDNTGTSISHLMQADSTAPTNAHTPQDTVSAHVLDLSKQLYRQPEDDSVFQDLLNDLVEELAEETLDKLYEMMKEKADENNWEKVNEWHSKMETSLNSKSKGRKFKQQNKLRFDQLEKGISTRCICGFGF